MTTMVVVTIVALYVLWELWPKRCPACGSRSLCDDQCTAPRGRMR